jgi:hypothetical protein
MHTPLKLSKLKLSKKPSQDSNAASVPRSVEKVETASSHVSPPMPFSYANALKNNPIERNSVDSKSSESNQIEFKQKEIKEVENETNQQSINKRDHSTENLAKKFRFKYHNYEQYLEDIKTERDFYKEKFKGNIIESIFYPYLE